MITPHEAERLRSRLMAVVHEDGANAERLLDRLDSLTAETGVEAHAALMLILTHLTFDEEVARRHWEAVLARRDELSERLGRDAGIRVALLDYFVNENRRLAEPALIDLEMYETARRESSVDALTGLSGDRRFRGALVTELARARRYGQRAAVILADVDDFAELNRRCGGLVGDRLLRELAVLLNSTIRDVDLAARPGEDEIAVLLPETDRNGALLVAERFRRGVQSYFAGRESRGTPVGLTVSAGVACFPDDAETPEALLERAAQALYQAKAAGRNGVQLFRRERRRFVRFDLDPGRFEIEVLAPADRSASGPRNLSRNGLLFTSPEPLQVGEQLEIRLAGGVAAPIRLRGRVVRLEELPPAHGGSDDPERYDVGLALDGDSPTGEEEWMEFLDQARTP